jgi:hypothetical protein
MRIVISNNTIKFSKYSALPYRRHHSTPLRINLFAAVDSSELNSWILDVSLHTSTYKINSGTSVNFTEEYGSFTSSTMSTYLS